MLTSVTIPLSAAVRLQVAHHGPGQLWVERGDRLVGQDGDRLLGQRAGDGDALLLAARQRVGALMGLVRQVDPLQRAQGDLAISARRTSAGCR